MVDPCSVESPVYCNTKIKLTPSHCFHLRFIRVFSPQVFVLSGHRDAVDGPWTQIRAEQLLLSTVPQSAEATAIGNGHTIEFYLTASRRFAPCNSKTGTAHIFDQEIFGGYKGKEHALKCFQNVVFKNKLSRQFLIYEIYFIGWRHQSVFFAIVIFYH